MGNIALMSCERLTGPISRLKDEAPHAAREISVELGFTCHLYSCIEPDNIKHKTGTSYGVVVPRTKKNQHSSSPLACGTAIRLPPI